MLWVIMSENTFALVTLKTITESVKKYHYRVCHLLLDIATLVRGIFLKPDAIDQLTYTQDKGN